MAARGREGGRGTPGAEPWFRDVSGGEAMIMLSPEATGGEFDIGALDARACPDCRASRGRALLKGEHRDHPIEIVCACSEIACRHCGEGRVWRPLSWRLDLEVGLLLYMPWYGYLIPCAACRAAGVGPRVVSYEEAESSGARAASRDA